MRTERSGQVRAAGGDLVHEVRYTPVIRFFDRRRLAGGDSPMRRPLVPVLMVAAFLAARPAIAAPHQLCAGFLTAPPGTRVGVPITLFDGDGVAGMQVDIQFDPASLAPAGVHLGADTAAAGVWFADSAVRGPGVLTVLLYTN